MLKLTSMCMEIILDVHHVLDSDIQTLGGIGQHTMEVSENW
jgi:hypothetical protein